MGYKVAVWRFSEPSFRCCEAQNGAFWCAKLSQGLFRHGEARYGEVWADNSVMPVQLSGYCSVVWRLVSFLVLCW